jgi:hypothetical protein
MLRLTTALRIKAVEDGVFDMEQQVLLDALRHAMLDLREPMSVVDALSAEVARRGLVDEFLRQAQR